MSAELEAAKQALAEALPLGGDPNAALDVLFGMVKELAWQMANFYDDLEEDGETVPPGVLLDLGEAVEGKLNEAVALLIEAGQ